MEVVEPGNRDLHPGCRITKSGGTRRNRTDGGGYTPNPETENAGYDGLVSVRIGSGQTLPTVIQSFRWRVCFYLGNGPSCLFACAKFPGKALLQYPKSRDRG